MKKNLSLILALIMLISCIPNVALADQEIEVYVSVAENGRFVTDENEESIAGRKIVITEENPTINHVFLKLHELYCEGGYETYESEYGLQITSFLGKSAYTAGYRNNHNFAMSLLDPVSDGANITFYFYQDTQTWSDRYTKFSFDEKEIEAEENIVVTLSDDFGNPIKDAFITVNDTKTEIITDEEGTATISFDEEGEYIVSVISETDILVPPVCRISVIKKEESEIIPDEPTEEDIKAGQDAIRLISDAIDFNLVKGKNENENEVTKNLKLYKGAYIDEGVKWNDEPCENGYKIEWSFSFPLVEDDGKIIRKAEDMIITVTAKITDLLRPYITPEEVSFDITILKQEEISYDTLIENIANKYKDASDEWKIMDMSAYSLLNPSGVKSTKSAKKKYINSVIKKIDESSDEGTLAKAIIILTSMGTDPKELYKLDSDAPVNSVEKLLNRETFSDSAWVAPYVLTALSRYDLEGERKSSIIYSILSKQNEDGSFTEYGETIQTTANIICGLAPYVESDEQVKDAVNKAVSFLSSVQKEDGTYDAYGYGDDTNTVAMLIASLSALGINTDTDERFIKNDISLYDTLFNYVLEDLSGFAYSKDDISYNDYSTEQAFRALICAGMVAKEEKPFNIYDFYVGDLKAGSETEEEKPSVPSTPGSGDKIKVKITIKGKESYWLDKKSFTVEKGSTMGELLEIACEYGEIKVYGTDEGYVSKMSYKDESYEEFQDGPDSGWLYKVNGKSPNIGINEYILKNNDNVVWYFTEDWVKSTGGFSGGNKKEEEKEEKIELPEKITVNFEDISEHWAKESIEKIASLGYLKGIDEKNFSPDELLTREMLITILYRMAGEPEVNGFLNPYIDISKDAYYESAVKWGNSKSIVKGTGNNLFSPERNVTREEFITMLYNYAKPDYETTDLRQFADSEKISIWAVNSIKWAVKKSLIKGKGEKLLAPDDYITRAELATIIERFISD